MTTYTIPHSAARALLAGSAVELVPGVTLLALPEVAEVEAEREREIPVLTADRAARMRLDPCDTLWVKASPGGTPVPTHGWAGTRELASPPRWLRPDPRLRLLGNPTPIRYGEAIVSIGHGQMTVDVPLGHPIHLAVEEHGLGPGRLFRLHPPGWPEVIVFASRVDVTNHLAPIGTLRRTPLEEPPSKRAEITFTEHPAAYDPTGSLAERLATVPPVTLSL